MSGPEWSRWLFVAGAVPYLVLGFVHASFTPRRPDQRKGLTPADAAVVEAMTRTRLLLTSRTDLWRAWVGFNLSHSLGAVAFAAFVGLLGRSHAAFEANAALAVPLALAISATYLAIGRAYWFRSPNAGIALSTALFAAACLSRL